MWGQRGPNLATVAARRLIGAVELAAQILWYPVTSFFLETPSYLENSEGYFLTRNEMDWFSSQYLGPPENGQNPDAAPLFAQDLSGLPANVPFDGGLRPPSR